MGPRAVLIGPPGAGKTTVGHTLAERWGVEFRDTDQDVEQVAGCSISDIFLTRGETEFRAMEREAVTTALASWPGVLALGGGAVLDDHAQAALMSYRDREGPVIFLDVSLAYAGPRVGFNQARPLLLGNPRARWQELMTARRPIYERLASITVLTDGYTPAQVVTMILAPREELS